MTQINNFMAVREDGEGVLGKLLYFSIGNVLIDKEVFNQTGLDMDLPKTGGTRTSITDAFKSATGDLYDRQVIKDTDSAKVVKVYCRDNDRTEAGILQRELVLEILGAETNRYNKMANLRVQKETGDFTYDVPYAYIPETYGMSKSAYQYCEQAQELFDLHRTCVHRGQVETSLENLLVRMQATKVSRGKIYFCPRSHMEQVDIFEAYVEELCRVNQNPTSTITVNSLYVVDDEKQREKMAGEFYGAIKKEIALYMEKINYLISSGSQSPAIMNRWVLKVNELEGKKRNYEDILQRDFENLSDEFSVLRLQAQELQVRVRKLGKCA
jgi:fructosamine-3-kinase